MGSLLGGHLNVNLSPVLWRKLKLFTVSDHEIRGVSALWVEVSVAGDVGMPLLSLGSGVGGGKGDGDGGGATELSGVEGDGVTAGLDSSTDDVIFGLGKGVVSEEVGTGLSKPG